MDKDKKAGTPQKLNKVRHPGAARKFTGAKGSSAAANHKEPEEKKVRDIEAIGTDEELKLKKSGAGGKESAAADDASVTDSSEKSKSSRPYDTVFVFDDPKKLRELEKMAIKSKRQKKESADDEEVIDFDKFESDMANIPVKFKTPEKAENEKESKKDRKNSQKGGKGIPKIEVKEEKKEEKMQPKAEPEDTAKKDTAEEEGTSQKPQLNGQKDYIVFQNVRKIYRMGEVEIEALAGVDFTISKGEFVIIAGASGAGKSTILNILGGMDSLSSGKIFVDDAEISRYNDKQLVTYRRYDVGFVFQFYNLVQNLNALENIQLATQICKNPLDAKQVIADVGLADRQKNFPSQLSGGEQQRVAIARALAKNPKLLLCDEPTGALDYKTGKSILKLLQDMSRKTGMTVVVITHNLALTAMGDRVIRVKSGKIESMVVNEHPMDIDDIEW